MVMMKPTKFDIQKKSDGDSNPSSFWTMTEF